MGGPTMPRKPCQGPVSQGQSTDVEGLKTAETALAHGLEFTFCFLIRDTPIHTSVVVLQLRNYRQASLLFFN